MRSILTALFTFASVLLVFSSVSKADSFLQDVSKYFNCKYKEEIVAGGLVVNRRTIVQLPGQKVSTCITTLSCDRNNTPTPTGWVAHMDLRIACAAPNFTCPVSAADCVTDASAATVTDEIQSNPN